MKCNCNSTWRCTYPEGSAENLACIERRRAFERETTWFVFKTIAALVVVTSLLALAHAWIAYGDVTCVIAKCVKVMP